MNCPRCGKGMKVLDSRSPLRPNRQTIETPAYLDPAKVRWRRKACLGCSHVAVSWEIYEKDLRRFVETQDEIGRLTQRVKTDVTSLSAVAHLVLPVDRRQLGDQLWMLAATCAASRWSLRALIRETLKRRR
jgi:hypothetical protein